MIDWRVDRQRVSEDEDTLARLILLDWNSATGQTLVSRDWLAKIIMRVREHPELTVDDHAAIVRANLAEPWWKGPPTPAVVYGNGAQFERAMMQARNPTARGGAAALDVAMDELRRMEAR